jgi:hypothetical protein
MWKVPELKNERYATLEPTSEAEMGAEWTKRLDDKVNSVVTKYKVKDKKFLPFLTERAQNRSFSVRLEGMTLENREKAWKQKHETTVQNSVETRILRQSLMVNAVMNNYNVEFREIDNLINDSIDKKFLHPTVLCEEDKNSESEMEKYEEVLPEDDSDASMDLDIKKWPGMDERLVAQSQALNNGDVETYRDMIRGLASEA